MAESPNQPAPSDTPTPRTDAVAKMIGRLAYQLKAGDIDLTSFALLAQSELDKMGDMERELTRLSAEREKERAFIREMSQFIANTYDNAEWYCKAKKLLNEPK